MIHADRSLFNERGDQIVGEPVEDAGIIIQDHNDISDDMYESDSDVYSIADVGHLHTLSDSD